MWLRSLGGEDPLEEGMAAHSSIPAWRIPWTEEPGGLQSTGSHPQDSFTLLHMAEFHIFMTISHHMCIIQSLIMQIPQFLHPFTRG